MIDELNPMFMVRGLNSTGPSDKEAWAKRVRGIFKRSIGAEAPKRKRRARVQKKIDSRGGALHYRDAGAFQAFALTRMVFATHEAANMSIAAHRQFVRPSPILTKEDLATRPPLDPNRVRC